MTPSKSERATTRRAAKEPHAHGRLYVFLVVTLAIFVAIVVLWRRPPSRYTARVVLKQTGRHKEFNDRGSIAAAIVDLHRQNATAGHCAGEMSPTSNHGHGNAQGESADAVPLADDAGHPHLLLDVQQDEQSKTITIWCAASTSQAARREAQLLAESYVKQAMRSDSSSGAAVGLREAKRATGDARKALQLAQADLKSFLNQHGDKLAPKPKSTSKPEAEPRVQDASQTPNGDRRSENGDVEEDTNEPAAPASPVPNPQWRELDERLHVLRAAREQLLRSKTEAHPEVRDLQWQIEKLEAEIALVPPTLPREDPPQHEPSQTVLSPPVDELPVEEPANSGTPSAEETLVGETPAEPSPELRRQVAKLKAAVAAARRQLDQAQAAENAAVRQAQDGSDVDVRIAQPAEIAATRGAGASNAAVFGGGVFALLIGFLVAWKSQRLREPAALIAPAQMESLGVPVVAAIPTRDGPELPVPVAFNPPWIAWLTFACELALTALAVCMALLLLVDAEMAGELVRDPLSALGEAVGRLW